jgi:hypothetical protein
LGCYYRSILEEKIPEFGFLNFTQNSEFPTRNFVVFNQNFLFSNQNFYLPELRMLCWFRVVLLPTLRKYQINIKFLTVLDHFTENSFHQKKFDRTFSFPNISNSVFWPNAIWPKSHLIESPFNRTPFDRKIVLPKKVIWPKDFLPKGSFTGINRKLRVATKIGSTFFGF